MGFGDDHDRLADEDRGGERSQRAHGEKQSADQLGAGRDRGEEHERPESEPFHDSLPAHPADPVEPAEGFLGAVRGEGEPHNEA